MVKTAARGAPLVGKLVESWAHFYGGKDLGGYGYDGKVEINGDLDWSIVIDNSPWINPGDS